MEQNNNLMGEISLRELIEILFKRKKMIAIITAISILAAGILSFMIIKPTYEAKMILMASNAVDKSNNLTDDGTIDMMLDVISQDPTMNIETYRQQVKTPAVLVKTIKDLHLEDEYNIDTLGDKITLETVKDTQLITIKKTGPNPDKASTIVNKVGENFIEAVADNVKSRATTTSKYVEAQMEVEKKNYDDALLELKELLSQPRGATELSLELDGKLYQITKYKTDLNDLSIRKDALNASINVAKTTPSNGSSITLNQNTGKILLDNSEKTLKLELAEVETNLVSIENKITQMQKDIEALQIEYQDRSHKESILNQKVHIAKNTYESFVKKYEELRVKESSQIGEASMTIISRAYPSTRPIGPRKALNLAIASVLGLMVGVFAAFFIEYWQATDTKGIKIPVTNNKE